MNKLLIKLKIMRVKISFYLLEKDIKKTMEEIKNDEKIVSYYQDIPKYAERADKLLKKIKLRKEQTEINLNRVRILKEEIRGLKC